MSLLVSQPPANICSIVQITLIYRMLYLSNEERVNKKKGMCKNLMSEVN